MPKDFSQCWLAATLSTNIQQRASELLLSYQLGHEATLELFHKTLKLTSDSNYVVTEQDARVVASRSALQVARLSLDRLKKDAKDFLKALKGGVALAEEVLEHFHPEANSAACQLSDAQYVVARAMGFSSWPKLRAHTLALAEAEASAKLKVLDEDLKTLHIRCGSDLHKALPLAGFKGDFLEVSNPFCHGPVVSADSIENFVAVREAFIREAYLPHMPHLDASESRSRIEMEEESLRALPGDYQRVVVWCEHDMFDQLFLAYVMHHLLKHENLSVRVELVQVKAFPGVKRFLGIGQLTQQPALLALLWGRRKIVTNAMMNFAARVWQAFLLDSPLPLLALSREANSALPVLQRSLSRMFQEFPDVNSGLSLTEHLILRIVQREGVVSRSRLFLFLLSEYEPQPFLGDVMCFYVIDGLCAGGALNDLKGEEGNPEYTLTALGTDLLNAKKHWMTVAVKTRFFGGVTFEPRKKCWCWNTQKANFEEIGFK